MNNSHQILNKIEMGISATHTQNKAKRGNTKKKKLAELLSGFRLGITQIHNAMKGMPQHTLMLLF